MKLEELVPKALRVLEANLEAENEHVRQRAADSVLDRAWGKAVLAIRTDADVPSDRPYAELTEEQREALMAQVRARLRVVQAERENGSAAD